MIRKSIKPETKVFNEIYEFGIFKGWNDYGDAIVQFNERITKLMIRRTLTEIEDDSDYSNNITGNVNDKTKN